MNALGPEHISTAQKAAFDGFFDLKANFSKASKRWSH